MFLSVWTQLYSKLVPGFWKDTNICYHCEHCGSDVEISLEDAPSENASVSRNVDVHHILEHLACPQCNSTYLELRFLPTAFKESLRHLDLNKTRFECTCKESCIGLRNLLSCMTTHWTPFVCMVCNNRTIVPQYPRLYDVVRHIMTVHQLRGRICEKRDFIIQHVAEIGVELMRYPESKEKRCLLEKYIQERPEFFSVTRLGNFLAGAVNSIPSGSPLPPGDLHFREDPIDLLRKEYQAYMWMATHSDGINPYNESLELYFLPIMETDSPTYTFEWNTPALLHGDVAATLENILVIHRYEVDYYEATNFRSLLKIANARSFGSKLKIRRPETYQMDEQQLTSEAMALIQEICSDYSRLRTAQFRLKKTKIHLKSDGVALNVMANFSTHRLELQVISNIQNKFERAVLMTIIHNAIKILSPAEDVFRAIPMASKDTWRGFLRDSQLEGRIKQRIIFRKEQKRVNLGYGGAGCWLSLFHGANCFYPDDLQSISKYPPAQGLRIKFDLLIQLAAVNLEVCYDGGIMLLGFDTALIPFVPLQGQEETIMRWHVVCTPGKQVTSCIADAFGDRRLKLQSLEQIPEIAALGWTSEATMVLGSDPLVTLDAGRSSSKPVKSHRKAVSHSKELNVSISTPFVPFFSLGGKIGTSNAFLPTRAARNPERNHAGILNQASGSFYILYDDSNCQGWLVPAINVLLVCMQLYLVHHKYIGFPSYTPVSSILFHHGKINANNSNISAEDALTKDVSYVKSKGNLEMSTQVLVNLLWFRISEGENLCRNPATQELLSSKTVLKGIELCDIAADGVLRLMEATAQGSMAAWSGLASSIPVIFCSGIGTPIIPSLAAEQTMCSQWELDQLPKGVLNCLTADLRQACRMARNLKEKQLGRPNVWRLCEEFEWKLAGGPFAPCSCDSSTRNQHEKDCPDDRTVCWSKARLQRICSLPGTSIQGKLGQFISFERNGGAQLSCSSVEIAIPPNSAVRFGFDK